MLENCPECGADNWLETSEDELPYWDEEEGFEPTTVYVCMDCSYVLN